MGGPVGWILDERDRERLLERFVPRFERVIAHHVTQWGHRRRAPVPAPAMLAIVGHVADASIEALLVTVDGRIERPDGSRYHCTWSLDPASGRVPKDANAMIAETDWTSVDPLPVSAAPGYVA
ncbi:hypothetical protein WJT74_07050 [Sphingomicrobium sp. XHP0239]|uniref:hypothetical protein n=1 Tax=Sphingomicrobium maritimum TaxID=3133972 RepID=UPI0031CC72B2